MSLRQVMLRYQSTKSCSVTGNATMSCPTPNFNPYNNSPYFHTKIFFISVARSIYAKIVPINHI